MAVSYTAIITPYHKDETINYAVMRAQVRRQIEHGHHIFCCGTNGDFTALTAGEKIKLVETCVDEAAGRVHVMANAGCPSTRETIALAREFQTAGVTAVSAVTPYFISCASEGLYQHYARLADALNVNVYLYDIPARTGNGLALDVIERLSRHGNIAGIKDSSGRPDKLDAYLEMARRRAAFQVFSGSDALVWYGMQHGATGCVSGLANLVPAWIRAIREAVEAGDADTAEQTQQTLTALRTELFALGYSPAITKRALFLLDQTVGDNRMPASAFDPALDTTIRAILENHGLIE